MARRQRTRPEPFPVDHKDQPLEVAAWMLRNPHRIVHPANRQVWFACDTNKNIFRTTTCPNEPVTSDRNLSRGGWRHDGAFPVLLSHTNFEEAVIQAPRTGEGACSDRFLIKYIELDEDPAFGHIVPPGRCKAYLGTYDGGFRMNGGLRELMSAFEGTFEFWGIWEINNSGWKAGERGIDTGCFNAILPEMKIDTRDGLLLWVGCPDENWYTWHGEEWKVEA